MSRTEPDSSTPGQAIRAGVIGLGMIGTGVVVSLARNGITPVVYDLRPEASAALRTRATPAASAAQVARDSDVVLISVFDAHQAMSVLTAPDGVLSAAREGLIVALLSTVTPHELDELAAVCAKAGVTLLDTPVTGGPDAARNGLIVMVGGPDDMAARVRPVLEGFGKLVVHCGPRGAGMAAKLARNALTYSGWAAALEAATIAQAGGVSLDRLFAVLAAGVATENDPVSWLRREVEGRPITPEHADFIDALAQKDLTAAQELAGDAGVEVPIVNVTRPRMRRVFGGDRGDPLPEDLDARGRVMLDRVYGDGYSGLFPAEGLPQWSVDTIEHLFAQIWSRPHLTVRDRRLMAIGATAMLGRPGPLETQIGSGLGNGDLTPAQAREIGVFLPYYVGWVNGTTVKEVLTKVLDDLDKDDHPAPTRPNAVTPESVAD
jgi:3-hydroxyisobutyrate dehydrogenase-like beta-hydroxyacid dehydrogenase/alkylhydroperoxidase/carboxymuconolactone decarboxylase family protein YurZ